MQVQQLPYLWSPDLLGALVSKSYSLAFKIQFAAVIVLTGLLMSTVGPASAACMIPRVGLWAPEDFSLCASATTDEMFRTIPGPALYSHGNCTSNRYSAAATVMNQTRKACTWYGSDRSVSSISALGGMVSNLTSSPPQSLSQMEIDFCEKIPPGCADVGTNSRWSTSGLWYSPQVNVPLTLSLDIDINSYTAVQARTSVPNRSLSYLLSLSADINSISEITNSMDAFSNVHCLAQNSVVWSSESGSLPLNFSSGEGFTDSAVQFTGADRERMSRGLLPTEDPFNEMLLLRLTGGHGYGFVWAYSGSPGYPNA